MSLTVLVIAAAHAVPIFIASGMSGGNKGVITIVAIIMAIVAVLTGGGAYAAIDLIVVAVAYFICIKAS